MVRIIVKSGYMKGKSHKEYYVNYIATREGVEKFKSDYGNMNATKKQQKLIQQLIKDYPTATGMFEYNDFKENLQLFEKEFCIKFDDDELANIIQIKKC